MTTLTRPIMQDLVLSLERAQREEGKGNLGDALMDIQDAIKTLKDEENRIIQKRRRVYV